MAASVAPSPEAEFTLGIVILHSGSLLDVINTSYLDLKLV